MAIYLKKFDNHTQYETYTADTSNFILPNVSLCTQENEVHYNPYVDPYGGHDYVEIGGLKWATMNVGATAVTDYGLYFQWGDTQGYTADQVGSGEGQKYFGWADYKYGNGTSSPGATGMTKYNSTDGLTTLQASDDAAVANWGGSWRMPTTAEFQELGNAVNTALTSDYKSTSIGGIVCTAKNGSGAELFFPFCGYCSDGSMRYLGSICTHWSSSLKTDERQNAYYSSGQMGFIGAAMEWQVNADRKFGRSIRPVAS